MSQHLTFWVGNRNPSITETISSGGSAVDLTSSTVKFQARQVGATALLVDAAVSNVPDATGVVRYDWAAADIAANGILFSPRQALVWWRVTTAGKTQDLSEALIEVRSHTSTRRYVELEQLKSSIDMTGHTFADIELDVSIEAACRDIEEACNRRFWLDADATSVRVYTPESTRVLMIDDLVSLTTLKVDRGGDGTFEETWTVGTNFVFGPDNAASDGKPHESIVCRANGGQQFPLIEQAVQVTGQFGWAAVPAQVSMAARLLAVRYFTRPKAPFGVVTVGSEVGAAIRLARTDPDVFSLIEPLSRRRPFL